mgnify:CR=1 FL=1
MADRKFIGQHWLGWLSRHRIGFFIWLRENLWCQVPHRRPVNAFWLFTNLSLNTQCQLHKPLQIKGQWVYLSGTKSLGADQRVEYLIVASYCFEANALALYDERWQTECLFKALKTSGIDLENTYLRDIHRLEKRLALVVLAFLWLYRIGQYAIHENPFA